MNVCMVGGSGCRRLCQSFCVGRGMLYDTGHVLYVECCYLTVTTSGTSWGVGGSGDTNCFWMVGQLDESIG